MEKIYSKVEPGKLLHIIHRLDDMVEPRVDIVPETEFIQCASLSFDKGKTFRPHKHLFNERTENKIAQESWVVLKGSVKCIFYDLDDTIIAEPILRAGDASYTLYGGHNYEILEDGSKILEYKTGPYFGQALDKTFID